MANRLAAASSPYLQQHADNPVHWWEWTEAAFDEARRRDVPVLLSVGYAACHWCHVMAHESFADPVIAGQMNEHFVCIKVDREERPDIDAIYMNATVAMTGQGGWPMTCFLTADGRPFYCGTYYPPQPRGGMPGFAELMAAITDTWRTRRDEIDRVGGQITEHLRANAAALPAAGVPIGDDLFDRAVEAILADEDREAGGFGGAPKFPPSAVLEALIRYDERRGAGTTAALPVVFRAAEAMARGGIYDQLAGGFARYSVDAGWVVPHFEKMLYDNAQLLRVYAHLARRTGNRLAVRVTEETVDFLQRDLLAAGGFAASLDADAAGVEGSTYVWTPAQLREVLGEADGAWAAELFTVTDTGTFEAGASVLQLLVDPDDPDRWQQVRRRLLDARAEREQPPRDDKVVAAWNGMAITALVEAGLALDRPDWIDLAGQVAGQILDRHLVAGRLRRSSLGGQVGEVPGMLDDHAALATGLLSLYQATGETGHRDAALRLIDAAVEIFGDPAEPGSFFDAPADGSALISRPRDPVDGATPAGGSLLAEALLTASMLAPAASAGRYLQLLEAALERSAVLLDRLPRSAGHWLAVHLSRADGPLHVTADSGELLATARQAAPGGAAVTGRSAEGQPPDTAMVCRGTVCSMPVTDPDELRALIGGA